MSQVHRVVGEHYTLHEIVGQGAMGEVYRATDERTGQAVAVKAIKRELFAEDPTLAERFQREADVLRRLNHPNIVKMFDWIEEGDETYIVMEYVGGGDLRSLLIEQKQLPLKRVLEIALDLSDALARAHRLNIIHRDIKPANVLLAEDGTPRLSDFGIAKMTDRTAMTETGSLVGTYAYISPEQCMGEAPSPRTDIWAFGVMLYEMLTRSRPYDADNPMALLRAILADPITPITQHRDDLPPALITLINGMLDKDEDKRLNSVRLIGSQIEAILNGTPTPIPPMPAAALPPTEEIVVDFGNSAAGTPASTPPTPTPPAAPVQKRRPTGRWIAGGLVALFLCVATLGALGFARQQRQNIIAQSTPATVTSVPENNFMVLVAEFEPRRNTQPRDDIQRDIVEDLREKYEESVPFSALRVREYPRVITTDEQALAAAQANGAIVVVWGSYDEQDIFVEVQAGTTETAGTLVLAREDLEKVANIRLTMQDPLRQSLALNIAATANAVFTATNNALGVITTSTVIDALGTITAVPNDVTSVAGSFHRFVTNYWADIDTALQNASDAIEKSGNNPITVTARGLARQRQGDFDQALEDFGTAKRLSGAGTAWHIPDYNIGAHYLFLEPSLEESLAAYNRVLEVTPDDWLALTFVGAIHQIQAERDVAYEYLQRAIANDPTESYPYILAVPLALRAGELQLAQEYSQTILTEYADPAQALRTVDALYSDSAASGLPLALSTYVNFVLGRYEQAIADAQETRQYPGFTNSVELYLLEGAAHCNLERYDEAITAYSAGIDQDEEFAVLYLLRAESRFRAAGVPGPLVLRAVNRDLTTARELSDSPEVDALVGMFQMGDLSITCENFFTATLPASP